VSKRNKAKQRRGSQSAAGSQSSGHSAHGALDPHAREGHARMAGGAHLGQAESEGRARRERQEIDSGEGGDGSSLLDGIGGDFGDGPKSGLAQPPSPTDTTSNPLARARAFALDAGERPPAFRVKACIAELMDMDVWETGRTVVMLQEDVWPHLALSTRKQYAVQANQLRRFQADTPALQQDLIRKSIERLDRAIEVREAMVGQVLQCVDPETGAISTKPTDTQALSNAVGRSFDSETKVADQLHATSGLVSTLPDVTINVMVGSAKTSVPADFAFAIARSVLESPSSPQRTAILAKAAEYSGAALPQIVESQ